MNSRHPSHFSARRFSGALLRALVVAITALAWLFPSVQCSMGCAVPLGSSLPSCCAPVATAGASNVCNLGNAEQHGGDSDSCRELAAEISSDGAERTVFAPVVLSLWAFEGPRVTPLENAMLVASVASPPASSFAERVLQESLFAHAPPHSR